MFRILQLAEASDFVVASGEVHTVREFARLPSMRSVSIGSVTCNWIRGS